MCGVAAWVGPEDSCLDNGVPFVSEMITAMGHRGPDDAGIWVDAANGAALGHRRLAIVDLTSSGRQPMISASGRFVIAFNGEIYNHLEMRAKLADLGIRWRGRSDTETLVEAIEAWGVRAALDASFGMFAFALWDRYTKELTVARDRFGEKPLYFGRSDSGWLVASELRAIRQAWPGEAELDERATADLISYDFVGSPQTILRGVWKLAAGTLARVRYSRREPMIERWWSLGDVVERMRVSGARSEREVLDYVRDCLGHSVDLQLQHSDVPIGIFLSGGVDSSLIAALAASRRSEVRTFTVGFAEADYDESGAAEAVAEYLGTDHLTAVLSPSDVAGSIVDLLGGVDEPIADPSVLPTMMVSRMARQHVTVAISGDGADELFGGYNRYRWLPGALQFASRLPPALRQSTGLLLQRRPGVIDRGVRWSGIGSRLRTPTEKAAKAIALLAADPLPSPATWPARGPLPIQLEWLSEPYLTSVISGDAAALARRLPKLSARETMMLCDAMHYLPDDVLTKVDRSSMSVSLESRSPFLYPTVVEAAMSVPEGLRFRDGVGKYVLRRLLGDDVPARLWDRPKMGFAVPLASWLRGPLRGWAEETIASSSLIASGFVPSASVHALWRAHCAGEADNQRALWPVLVLENWISRHSRNLQEFDVRVEVAGRFESG